MRVMTTMKTRRDLMVTASYGAAAVAIASTVFLDACKSQTPDQLQADVQLVVAGAQAVVGALSALPNIPPAIIAQAQAALKDIQENAQNIANALSPTGDAVAAIQTAVNTLATLVAPYFPQGGQYAAIIDAAVALVGVIVSLAGAKPAPKPANSVAMTPDHAREVLRAVQ